MDILKFEGYEGTVDVDMTRGVCRGKILFIDDLVTYEAESPKQLQAEFEAAVTDYVETCAAIGKPAQTPLKGQFNVRVQPQTHKGLVLRATEEGVSLNEIVARACDAFVCIRTEVNHKVTLTLEVGETAMQSLVASASVQNWGAPSVH